jgi:uncharacterized protein (TIGR02147 family)
MKSIFTYSDYREYIKDAISEKQKKNRRYSYRSVASHLGIGSGTLSRIINGSRHCGAALLPKMTAFLGLKRREAEYFTLLVSFELLKDEEQRRQCYRDLLRMRNDHSALVPEEKHQFFEKWYHVALYELMRIIKKPVDCAAIGAMLLQPLTESKTRKTIELLKRLGYLKEDDENDTCTTEPFLTTGETWEGVAIHAFQVAMSDLATRALDTVPKEERDFSTLTMALSEESFERIRDVIKKARAEIAQIERECDAPERVYQVNFQCFPLTVPYKKGRSQHAE